MSERGEATEQNAVRDVAPAYQATPELKVLHDAPSGYKRTEVGLIPKDWNLFQLGDIAKVSSGGTPSRRVPKYWNGDIPWVTTSEIDFSVVNQVEQFITHEGLKNSAASWLPPGTILLALYGQGKTRGKVGFLGIDASTNQACAVISLNTEVDNQFIFHFLVSKYEEIRKLSNTGNQENLNSSIVRSIPVLTPPLSEQRAIATALSDADALIESLDRLIAKKRAIKQAAMQQLLTGQTRLPGFVGEWATKKLVSICEIRSGGTPSTLKAEFWDGYIPWCTPTDITALRGKKYLSKTERTISDAGLRNSSAEVIPPKSIIMTTRATIGECAINTVPMTTNQGFKNLMPTSADCEYLYYLMTMQKARLVQLCAGSTFLEIGKKQLALFEVYLPEDLEEQHAIANVLSDMEAKIEALERHRDKARQIKQGMMQQLLTGRVRLV